MNACTPNSYVFVNTFVKFTKPFKNLQNLCKIYKESGRIYKKRHRFYKTVQDKPHSSGKKCLLGERGC